MERVLIGYAAPSNTYYLHDMIGSLLRIYNAHPTPSGSSIGGGMRICLFGGGDLLIGSLAAAAEGEGTVGTPLLVLGLREGLVGVVELG